MPQNPYVGKRLRLNDGCLFFQLERNNKPTIGFLLRLKPTPDRWHTEKKSAIMLLDLLVRGESNVGIRYDDLKKHLLRQYDLDDSQDYQNPKNVNKHLKDFLDKLRAKGVLKEVNQHEDVDDPLYPDLGPGPHPPHEDPIIASASSIFCCGYVVSRYRP